MRPSRYLAQCPRALWPRIGPVKSPSLTGSVSLPKRNYNHEKRQKELNRQRKKEEKLQRKVDRTNARSETADAAESAAPDRSPEE